jgi:hypothetical protein
MSVLWVAFGIYIVGITLVLFLRPALMFKAESGEWKEFGIGASGSHTLFPFWMFAILWAIVSYSIATLGAVFFGNLTLASATAFPAAATATANIMPISSVAPAVAPATATAAPQQMNTPGYYVLENASTPAPKYVYYGPTPPPAAL